MTDTTEVIKNWLWQVALKKAVVTICQVVVAFIMSKGIDKLLGLTIDVNQMALGILGLLEISRNWIKVKFGVKWL